MSTLITQPSPVDIPCCNPVQAATGMFCVFRLLVWSLTVSSMSCCKSSDLAFGLALLQDSAMCDSVGQHAGGTYQGVQAEPSDRQGPMFRLWKLVHCSLKMLPWIDFRSA